MTNDKIIPYNFNNRMGYVLPESKRIVRSLTITHADETDTNDVYRLGMFHHKLETCPFRDSIEHLIRNPRNVTGIALVHTCEAPISITDDCFEATVKEEEVAGFLAVCPNDTPSSRANYIKVGIRCLLHNLSLGEEEVANLIYETIYQYVAAKIKTEVPTKLEVNVWLPQSETKWFKIVVGYLNAAFHDSYLPLRVNDISHEVHYEKKIPLDNTKLSAKTVLRNLRRSLNTPSYYEQVEHRLIFPRLPGPMK